MKWMPKMRNQRRSIFWCFAILSGWLMPGFACGDEVTIQRDDRRQTLTGKVIVEGQDKGLLFRADDGKIWFLQPDEIQARTLDDEPFKALEGDALEAFLAKSLPDGFKVHRSEHYFVCYDTSEAYARWISGLYERLYDGYFEFWKKKDLELEEPDGPMIVMVFKDRENYQRYMNAELGQTAEMVAFYNLKSNRVALYDLTRTQEFGGGGQSRFREINRVLASERAGPMVATVVHEATHQLIFNTGLQTRFAESPLWLNEGLAIYFETPDLSSKRGWRGIGKLNRLRLIQFRQALQRRTAIPLARMIGEDAPFRDSATAADAYAQAWAFNYFLLRRKPKPFAQYLRHMSQKKPLQADTPEARVNEFRKFFGDELDKLEAEFVRYVRKLR